MGSDSVENIAFQIASVLFFPSSLAISSKDTNISTACLYTFYQVKSEWNKYQESICFAQPFTSIYKS